MTKILLVDDSKISEAGHGAALARAGMRQAPRSIGNRRYGWPGRRCRM